MVARSAALLIVEIVALQAGGDCREDELIEHVFVDQPSAFGASPIANYCTVMEVPFISSGASSRAHYVLVRKVELAQTTQQADDYLLEEVVALRDRLSRPGFTSVGLAPFPAGSFR